MKTKVITNAVGSPGCVEGKSFTFSTMKAFSHQNRRDTEERLLDDEISELLDPDEPADSVMDSNSSEDERNEDSAEEVDDLLGS